MCVSGKYEDLEFVTIKVIRAMNEKPRRNVVVVHIKVMRGNISEHLSLFVDLVCCEIQSFRLVKNETMHSQHVVETRWVISNIVWRKYRNAFSE